MIPGEQHHRNSTILISEIEPGTPNALMVGSIRFERMTFRV